VTGNPSDAEELPERRKTRKVGTRIKELSSPERGTTRMEPTRDYPVTPIW